MRGVAVIGILVINALDFALPGAARVDPTAWGDRSWGDRLTWAIEWIAFDNKMRGLFSVLFGASLLVVADRTRAAGRSVWSVHGPRLATLCALGAAHNILIWDGDILVLYALVGLLAVPFLSSSIVSLAGGAAAAFTMAAVLALAIGSGAAAAAQTSPVPTLVVADLTLRGSPYMDQMAARASVFFGAQFRAVLAFGPDTLGLMLLGMVLVRLGLLTGQWRPERARRLALLLAVGGGVPMAGLAAWNWTGGFPPDRLAFSYFALAYPLDLALTVAWAAGLSAWASVAAGWLPRALEGAGRFAFSNYVGTSVVMVAIFSGPGGLYGSLSRWQTLVAVLVGAALMLAWSRPWLQRFSYGPLEWLWRSLARARLQPMARPALPRP